MKRILVVHGLNFASRTTNLDHVFCLSKEFPEDYIQYQHCFAPVSNDLAEAHWDLCLFTYCALTIRAWQNWERIADQFLFLNDNCDRIALIPQDDYTWSLALDKWAKKFKVEIIFTPLMNDLGAIYPHAISSGAKLSTVLTGYFNPDHLSEIEAYAKPFEMRTWDVGTRVNFLRAYLGRAAQKKGQIALSFRNLALQAGLKQSISTSPNDVLLGMKWFEFLGDCRFTVGSLGGASMLDPDGSRRERVNDYISMHPDADFEEIEAACFPGEDGYDFSAIGPRIIEAAATRTCQILSGSDEYLPGMEPWIHYIPLADDCSNFDTISAFLSDHRSAEQIANNCYDLIIRTGDYLYGKYANHLINESMSIAPRKTRRKQTNGEFLEKVQSHNQFLGKFELLKQALDEPLYSAMMINLWRNSRFHRLDGILDAAQRVLETGDGSVLGVNIATYPPRPYSKFELESSVTYLRVLRDCGMLGHFIEIIERAIHENWQPTAFYAWDFCDFTGPQAA